MAAFDVVSLVSSLSSCFQAGLEGRRTEERLIHMKGFTKMKTIRGLLFLGLLLFIVGCGGDDGGGAGAPSSITGNQLGLDGVGAFARQGPICNTACPAAG